MICRMTLWLIDYVCSLFVNMSKRRPCSSRRFTRRHAAVSSSATAGPSAVLDLCRLIEEGRTLHTVFARGTKYVRVCVCMCADELYKCSSVLPAPTILERVATRGELMSQSVDVAVREVDGVFYCVLFTM